MKTIKDCAVRIALAPNQRELIAKMPDGQKIPFVTAINVRSEVRSLVKATIELIVHVDDIETWQHMITKEVVVQNKISGEDLLLMINRSKTANEKTG